MNEQNINPGIFGLGNPNNAYSQYFSGRSWLKMLTVERLVTANVTFEAGCRNNWHVHHNLQVVKRSLKAQKRSRHFS